MAILIDPVTTHDDSNTGNNTVPPGITGLDWCHAVSDVDGDELTGFVFNHQDTIAADPNNVRTPAKGSLVTYIGLTQEQHDAAVAAGAIPGSFRKVIANAFDSGDNSLYEPEA